MKPFPAVQSGQFWLTEPGLETEIMYRDGYELPEFSMQPLLDQPQAIDAIRKMIEDTLSVAANNGAGAMIGAFDYRASPDWGAKLGYSPQELEDRTKAGLRLLRDWAAPFEDRLGGLYIFSYIGPRGDAYGTGGAITADEAEAYHTTQLETLKDSEADGALAATFNNIPESVGLARAAAKLGVPLGLSLTLTSDGVLRSGPTLKQAIEEIDAQTGDARPDFYMVNCAHPTEFEPSLADEPWLRRIRGFVPNAVAMEKLALCKLGHIEDGDPVELGGQLGALAAKYPWMDIWGGCCGTGAPHLEHIAKEVGAARAA